MLFFADVVNFIVVKTLFEVLVTAFVVFIRVLVVDLIVDCFDVVSRFL